MDRHQTDVAEQASWRYLPSILFSLRPESRADRFRSPAAWIRLARGLAMTSCSSRSPDQFSLSPWFCLGRRRHCRALLRGVRAAGLALLFLGRHDGMRTWKFFEGLISDLVGKT